MSGEAPVEICADGDSDVSNFTAKVIGKRKTAMRIESSLKENVEEDQGESSNNGHQTPGVFYSGREGVK